MVKCDHRLDASLLHGTEKPVVKFNALSIGFRLMTCRIESCPCDGNTKYLESHLLKKVKILFETMIKIYSMTLRIVGGVGFLSCRLQSLKCYRCVLFQVLLIHLRLKGLNVLDTESLTVFIPGTLALIRCQCSAP